MVTTLDETDQRCLENKIDDHYDTTQSHSQDKINKNVYQRFYSCQGCLSLRLNNLKYILI